MLITVLLIKRYSKIAFVYSRILFLYITMQSICLRDEWLQFDVVAIRAYFRRGTEQNGLFSQLWKVFFHQSITAFIVEYTHHGVNHNRWIIIAKVAQHFQQYLYEYLFGSSIQLVQRYFIAGTMIELDIEILHAVRQFHTTYVSFV